MKTDYKFSTLITGEKKKPEFSNSIFLITINSNKSLNSRDIDKLNNIDQIEECFKELSDNLFKDSNVMKLLCEVEGSGKDKIYKPLDKEDVKSILISSQLECNKDVRGFVHLHTTINVVHKKKIQVNLELLKRVVYRKMESCLTINGKYYKPYVNIRGKKGTYNMENYASSSN